MNWVKVAIVVCLLLIALIAICLIIVALSAAGEQAGCMTHCLLLPA
jgi:hypothetical protein